MSATARSMFALARGICSLPNQVAGPMNPRSHSQRASTLSSSASVSSGDMTEPPKGNTRLCQWRWEAEFGLSQSAWFRSAKQVWLRQAVDSCPYQKGYFERTPQSRTTMVYGLFLDAVAQTERPLFREGQKRAHRRRSPRICAPWCTDKVRPMDASRCRSPNCSMGRGGQRKPLARP